MAFWGVEVKPGKPFTLKATETRRLHLSQATLGLGNATTRSILQCNVGNKSPLFLCVLSPEKVDSCQLNIEFEEADEVIFSVIGPRSVHLTGYFLGKSTALRLNDDESESFGEDIVDTDMEKGSSDDYDYSDSFINDDDPSGRGSHVSSTDDDEKSIEEMSAKKDTKRNGKGGRLRKKFHLQIFDSDSDESSGRPLDDSSIGDSVDVRSKDNDQKIPKVLSSEIPLPLRVTRSKARSSIFENGEPNAKCEKTFEVTTHDHNTLDEREDKPSGDVELSALQKGSETISKKKRNKEKSKTLVVIDLNDGEEKHIPEHKEKQATDKGIESSNDVLNSQNGDATSSKKKRKRDKREESREKKKQATENHKNNEKEAGTNKPVESVGSSPNENEVSIEVLEEAKVDGKVAASGKKVSILYTGMLKDTGKVFESNMGEAPLRFRLGGEKVIKGLSMGVEGMRVGEKRRLTIPPSLGYSEKESKEGVPKNMWLVYEVEAVKVK